MHVSYHLRETARAALIEIWAREGFRVPARQNATFQVPWEMTEWPDEIRKGIGIVSDHEAVWRARQGL